MIVDVPIATAWNVQGDPASSRFLDTAALLLGVALPVAPNTTARGERSTAFWLGPQSWLIVADEAAESAPTAFHDKRTALNGVGAALFDVSASRVALRIAGPHAAKILSSACPLDLHPRVFATGACAQSVLGRVNALVHKVDTLPTFVVMVAQSLALDVRRALETTAAQYR